MILPPFNDKACLSLLHAEAKRLAALPWVRAWARRFRTVRQVRRFIRRLKQRDDLGALADGPRLPCAISQRLRFAPADPNCFERTLLFLVLSEILDARTGRSSASMVIDAGWHTFPVEVRNGLPHIVVLDPDSSGPPRNAMVATAYDAQNVALDTPDVLGRWFAEVTRNACLEDAKTPAFDVTLDALWETIARGGPIDAETTRELDRAFDLAERDAALWGHRGRLAAERAGEHLRNLALGIDSGRVGALLADLARTGQTVAPKIIRAALVAKFGPAAGLVLDGAKVTVEPGVASVLAPAKGGLIAAIEPAQRALAGAEARKETAIDGQDERRRVSRSVARRMSFAFRTNN